MDLSDSRKCVHLSEVALSFQLRQSPELLKAEAKSLSRRENWGGPSPCALHGLSMFYFLKIVLFNLFIVVIIVLLLLLLLFIFYLFCYFIYYMLYYMFYIYVIYIFCFLFIVIIYCYYCCYYCYLSAVFPLTYQFLLLSVLISPVFSFLFLFIS